MVRRCRRHRTGSISRLLLTSRFGGESNSYNIFIKIYELAVQFSSMLSSSPGHIARWGQFNPKYALNE